MRPTFNISSPYHRIQISPKFSPGKLYILPRILFAYSLLTFLLIILYPVTINAKYIFHPTLTKEPRFFKDLS